VYAQKEIPPTKILSDRHGTPHRTKGFLYKPRHCRILSRSAWSSLSLLALVLLWVISSSKLLDHSIRVYSSEFWLGCPGSRVKRQVSDCSTVHIIPWGFQTTAHSANKLEDLQARLFRTLLTTTVSNSKSLHMYIYIYIYISCSNRGYTFIVYAHFSGSTIVSIHGSFSFLLSASIIDRY